MRRYAKGTKAWYICGRCGMRGLYAQSLFDGYYPNMRVHQECWEPKHPQEKLFKVSDPIALWRPQPEYGGTPPVLAGFMSGVDAHLSWTEAEIWNARFESYDVYRAVVDSDGDAGDYLLIIQLPIVYDDFMAILSQTLVYVDAGLTPGVTYSYYIFANASNGPGDPDGDFSQVSNKVELTPVADTFYILQETGFHITLEDDSGSALLEVAP